MHEILLLQYRIFGLSWQQGRQLKRDTISRWYDLCEACMHSALTATRVAYGKMQLLAAAWNAATGYLMTAKPGVALTLVLFQVPSDLRDNVSLKPPGASDFNGQTKQGLHLHGHIGDVLNIICRQPALIAMGVRFGRRQLLCCCLECGCWLR